MMYGKEIEWKRLGPNGGALSAFFYDLIGETHKYFYYHVRFLARNRTEYKNYTPSAHKPLSFSSTCGCLC